MTDYLVPQPQQITEQPGTFERPRLVKITRPADADDTARMLINDLHEICGIGVSDTAPYTIELSIDPASLRPEGYRLYLAADKARVTGHGADGLFYGAQTLLQILALGPNPVNCMTITDWPHYRTRSIMLDMGRGVYTPALIRRMIRIMARLKLNSLHLHLFDDHLNSIRFRTLPLGSENPHALTTDQYAEIIRYARQYHISVVPEFELWGHAGSILYHYPKLYGAPGMWEGFSFGIGEELYDLFYKMLDEFIPIIEPKSVFHVGLDEANWALLPSVTDPDKYSPTLHVERLYDMLMEIGARNGKEITMRLWADHGGRPLPDHLVDKVIVEPWMYFEGRASAIREKVATYAGEGKTPFMMGGGMSSLHFDGHYGATRLWCKEGQLAPNCEGINICIWETNEVVSKMIGIYGGADSAWMPDKPDYAETDLLGEWARGKTQQRMRTWQATFRDADPNSLALDRGPEVYEGKFVWPPLTGVPAAPTALLVDPRTVDAFHEDQIEPEST